MLIALPALTMLNPLFADYPAPTPPEGYTTTSEIYFKQLGLSGAYTYDAASWAGLDFIDSAVFTYYRAANPEAEPPITEDTQRVREYGTASGTIPLNTEGLELNGGNNSFTLDGGNTLTFGWANIRSTDFIIDNATLNIADNPPSGAATDNWFNDRTLTLTNGAALNAGTDGNKSIKTWNHSIVATDSAISGGLNGWHYGRVTLTNSTWTAKGTTMFQYHGNGNYQMVLDNSHATLQANNAEGTSYNAALSLYAHSATSTNPLGIELKNGSTFTAGKFNDDGYAVVAGGEGWMGWTAINNGKISIDVNTGSKFTMGSLTMGRQDACKQASAEYSISVGAESDSARSMAAFTTMNMALSTHDDATLDSYKTSIAVGDYSDLRISNLNMGSVDGAKNGTASISVGSNSSLYVLTDGYGGDARIGQAARLGGLAEVRVDGENSTFFTAHMHLGNAASQGGTNRVEIKNSTADEATRNNFYAFAVNMYNSTLADSAQTNEFIVDGNAYIHGRPGTGDTSFRFNVGTNESAAGTSAVTLKGENVRFGYLFQMNIGNLASTGGLSKISIQGSDIKSLNMDYINLSDNLGVRAGGGADAILEFVADANGFSFLNANTIDFSGILALDFSAINTDLAGDILRMRDTGSASFQAWADFCDAIVNGDKTHLQISGLSENFLLEFTFNGANGTLGYQYTAVPEPQTCAAILGAIALGLAAYRRRRG